MALADKGYAHDPTRRALRRRRIPHTIPERVDQVTPRAARRSAGGRPPDFDKQLYRHRNVIERCFNRLEQWRDLATRYAKRASIYRSSLTLIAAIIWLTGSAGQALTHAACSVNSGRRHPLHRAELLTHQSGRPVELEHAEVALHPEIAALLVDPAGLGDPHPT